MPQNLTMHDHLVIETRADLSKLEDVLDRIESFGASQRWSDGLQFQVRLVLEEYIVNIISHGSKSQVVPELKIMLTQTSVQLELMVADNGMAFDPLQAAHPNLDMSLDERAIGGLGVHLMRQMMDQFTYQRDGEWNRLLSTKALV